MSEIWKDVAGYEGAYQVSDRGRVRSVARKAWNGQAWHTHKGRILKQSVAGKMQYRQVALCKDCKAKTQRVHALVAKAFLGPCPGEYGKKAGQYGINHIDSDTSNNRAENLEWATAKENLNHAYRTNGQTPLRNFKNLTVNGVTKTMSQWARDLGGAHSLIGDRVGRGWTIEEAVSLPVGSFREKR